MTRRHLPSRKHFTAARANIVDLTLDDTDDDTTLPSLFMNAEDSTESTPRCKLPDLNSVPASRGLKEPSKAKIAPACAWELAPSKPKSRCHSKLSPSAQETISPTIFPFSISAIPDPTKLWPFNETWVQQFRRRQGDRDEEPRRRVKRRSVPIQRAKRPLTETITTTKKSKRSAKVICDMPEDF
jgi:hypothetical protein